MANMNLGSVSSTQTKSTCIISPEVAESVVLNLLRQGPPSGSLSPASADRSSVLCGPCSQSLCHSCCLRVLCLIHTAHLNCFLIRFLIWLLVPPANERESTIILSKTAPASRSIDAIHLKVCFLAAIFPVTWAVPYIPRWSVIQALLLKLFLFFFFLSSSLFVELFWYRSAIVWSGCPHVRLRWPSSTHGAIGTRTGAEASGGGAFSPGDGLQQQGLSVSPQQPAQGVLYCS